MGSLLDKVSPGDRDLFELHVGQLPSGTEIRIKAHLIRAEKPGPVVLLLGGVHGDEINGIEIVRRAVSGNLADRLQCGSVLAIPLLNVFGFLNFARDVPDGKDVNRSFPGMTNGSLASRVAYLITHAVLPEIDFGFDFHTGGNSIFNFPQTRYSPDDAVAKDLAKSFAAPVMIKSSTIAKSLRETAKSLGKPIVIYEGGENLRLNKRCIKEALDGVERVLVAQGMLENFTGSLSTAEIQNVAEESARTTVEFEHHRWLRTTHSGLFEWIATSGDHVEQGDLLGYVRDPYGNEEIEILSPRKAMIIGQDNSPVINEGDAIFHLAW